MKYPDVTMGQVEAAINIIGGWDEFLQLLRGELVVKAAELLKQSTTVNVSGTRKFVAKDAFGPDNPDGIKFYLGDNFKRSFLGKIEEDVKSETITVHRLEKLALNPKIMAELGEKRVIKLAHFFQLIKSQAIGQKGPLLVNGYANIAYIEDENKTFWAVGAGWDSISGEWSVLAISVGYPGEWDAGFQVFSRK